MRLRTLFLGIFLIATFTFLSIGFSATETRVDVHSGGLVGVQGQDQAGNSVGDEEILSPGQGADVSQDGAVQERVATSNPEADALLAEQDQADKCAIVRQFVELISRRDPRALDMLCDDFNNVIGAATYNKAEFDRYLQDWYRMSNNQTIEITTCRKIGDCVKVDAKSVSYLGQAQWRSERKGIAICFSGDKICSIRGELISLPDFANNVTIESGDFYDGRRVNRAFEVNAESASRAQPTLITGQVTLSNIITDFFDIDTQVKGGSGDIWRSGGAILSAVAPAGVVLTPLNSRTVNANDWTFQSTVGITPIAVGQLFLWRSKQGRLCVTEFSQLGGANPYTFRYWINPVPGANTIDAN